MEYSAEIDENGDSSTLEAQQKQKAGKGFLSFRNIILLGMVALSISSVFFKSGIAASFLGASNCNIKGNISRQWHQKIYYVPGNRKYYRIKISPQWGERWFCSQKEARAAGWRKARW